MPQRETLVLGGDVGGTNTKIALARMSERMPVVLERRIYKSREYASLENIIEHFLARPEVAAHAASITGACFAVAGPIDRGTARLTNLPWVLAEDALAAHLRFPRVRIINDFAAAGRGIDLLAPQELTVLQSGVPVPHAPRVVVGAGTGLGVALLEWDGATYEVHSSEAGHIDFAPTNETQDALLSHLRGELGRVSYERVVCGAGLVRILEFLRDTGRAEPGAALTAAMTQRDPAGAITDFASADEDEAASRAVDIFVEVYGAFTGNMALIMLSHGGAYIAGGIAPRISRKLADGTFMRAFLDKGRLSSALETMPVQIVMNDHVGLLGAVAEAGRD